MLLFLLYQLDLLLRHIDHTCSEWPLYFCFDVSTRIRPTSPAIPLPQIPTLTTTDENTPPRSQRERSLSILPPSPFLVFDPSNKLSPRQPTPAPRASTSSIGLDFGFTKATPKKKIKATPLKPRPGETTKPKRGEKKRLAEEWIKRRDEVCADLIACLDEQVFGSVLPEDLELIWSKRLNTTAGRARWKRVRQSGQEWKHECKIELSTKVLDSEGEYHRSKEV